MVVYVIVLLKCLVRKTKMWPSLHCCNCYSTAGIMPPQCCAGILTFLHTILHIHILLALGFLASLAKTFVAVEN